MSYGDHIPLLPTDQQVNSKAEILQHESHPGAWEGISLLPEDLQTKADESSQALNEEATFWGLGFPVPGLIWDFPKIMGTISGVPTVRVIVFWDQYWAPLILWALPNTWALSFNSVVAACMFF